MAKLSENQLIIVSKAAQRADGAGEVSGGIKGAAAARLGTSLVAQKLMREIRSKPGMPVWRKDENDRAISLVLLSAGRAAAEEAKVGGGTSKPNRPQPPSDKGKKRTAAIPETSATEASALPRPGSKQATVIEMLYRESGSTLAALVTATGWLPHSTRAALSGLRKRGFQIVHAKDDKRGSVYRIASRKAA